MNDASYIAPRRVAPAGTQPTPPPASTKYAIDLEPRCWNCGKLLALTVTRPWTIRCGRCKEQNSGDHQGHPRTTRAVDDGG